MTMSAYDSDFKIMKNILLMILGAGVLLLIVQWMKFGSTDHGLGFDLTGSAKAAAQRVAGEREYQILRERPQTFVDSFDEISLIDLVNQVISDKYTFRLERPQRTYHFRIIIEGKAYYWSFSEREFLPTRKSRIWDSDQSLLVHMSKKCSIFRSLNYKDREASFEQTRRQFDVSVNLDSFCRN